MSIMDFIAVMSFDLTCFGIGHTFGKDSNNTQKSISNFRTQEYRYYNIVTKKQ